MRKLLVILLLTAAVIMTGCRAPVPSSTDGVLKGTVSIGPINPVEQSGVTPTVSPAVFAARKILVYDSSRKNILFTVDIIQIGQTAVGRYQISLAPGSYVIDLKPNGIDHSSEVPKTITIASGTTQVLDINIDTGIR